MPRISPVAIRQAHHISPYAAQLLPVCRDLQSALNEARWIREHVEERRGRDHEIAQLCRRRARGEPLQYVLGTQPFGNLDMKCRPGVLIPRYVRAEKRTMFAVIKILPISKRSNHLGLSPRPTPSISPTSSCRAPLCWEEETTAETYPRPYASSTSAQAQAA